MYLDQEQATSQGAANNPLFWTTAVNDEIYTLQEEDNEDYRETVEVIEVGSELPSEPCEPPAFLTYMMSASEPETLSGEWSLPPGTPAPAQHQPEGSSQGASLTPGQQISVSGTLQVQGMLTVDDRNQAHLHITSTMSQSQAAPAAPFTAPTSLPTSMSQQRISSSVAGAHRETGTNVSSAQLMSLLEQPTDHGQGRHRGPGQGAGLEEEGILFVENIEHSPLPVFSVPLSNEELAFSTKTSTQSANSNKPCHTRALSSQADQCTLLPDTGAVDNLIGSLQAARFSERAKQTNAKVMWSLLKQPRLVSGVGGAAQIIRHQMTVTGQITPSLHMKYSAPVVEGIPAEFQPCWV
eukprot:3901114-Amphidinium_carterae.2